MGKAAHSAALAQAEDAVYEGEESFVGRISAFVQRQANKLVDLAAPMMQVYSSPLSA